MSTNDFDQAVRRLIRKRMFNTAVILMMVQVHREERA